jgi:hypothetical protein
MHLVAAMIMSSLHDPLEKRVRGKEQSQVWKNIASSLVNLHRSIQDENSSALKNEPLTALRWSRPGIPQNLSTTIKSPHKTNLHLQKGMYQRMNEDRAATSHPRKGRKNL